MRFTLRIAGLILASTVIFQALAITEQWELFYSAFSGDSLIPSLPPEKDIAMAIHRFANQIERLEVGGHPNSPAHQASRRDVSFRTERGIEQRLRLLSLSVEEIYGSGPGRVVAKTLERSHLRVRRSDGAPRWYYLNGTWMYTLINTPSGWGVSDVEPHVVDLIPTEQELDP